MSPAPLLSPAVCWSIALSCGKGLAWYCVWPNVPAEEQAKRFPFVVPVGTSATIKSLAEENRPPKEIIKLRDEAVQEFFS